MSNLLEKASIITTPTAYSSGFIHSVKPSESPYADFTFTRNSPATRVNSQGIVESVQILGSNVVTNGDFSQIGSELITNGNFSNGSTGWILGNWTVADGKASLVSGSSLIQQTGILEAGKTYKIQYEILEYSSGNIRWRANFVNGSTNGSVKLVTDFITVAGTTFSIQGYNSFTGSISNISAVEIIDWTAGDGWSFGGNKASCDGTQTSSTNLVQTISTNIQNQLVKISFTLDISAGTLSGSLFGSGGAEFDALTTSGNYSVEATSSDVNPIILFQGDANFVGSISNVVIKSVTNDTDLPRINYENGSGSWLLEPQTTNLTTYSEDFSQWTIGGDTTIESGYLAPDGTNSAYKISGTNNNIKLTVANLLGTSQRTIFARTVSGTGTARLLTHRTNTNNLFSITEQWQRFKINSTTVSASESVFFGIDFRVGSLSEIILWGANATNNQDFETSYIPTSGSPQTRSQDLATNTGNSDLISSTEGVLYVEIASLANDNTHKSISINNNGDEDLLLFRYSSNNKFQIIFRSDSNNIVNQIFDLANNLDFNKIAFSYKLNEFKTFVNGVQIGSTVTNGIVFNQTVNSLDFNEFNGTNNFFGKAKCVAVFKEALTDAELICLTTI